MGYRYFDFRALDNTLDAATQRELEERVHERARINDRQLHLIVYFGASGVEADELLRDHFDMMLTAESYGTMKLAFKLPRGSLLEEVAAPYLGGPRQGQLTLETKRQGEIVSLFLCDAAPNWQEEDADWLSELTPLREELLGGDLRPFYLCWLALAAHGHLAEEALEPPVPPGMDEPREHHLSFARRFGISDGLLEAARPHSAPRTEDETQRADALLDEFDDTELRQLVRRVILGEEVAVGQELRRRARAMRDEPPGTSTGRTVAELLEEAEGASRRLEAQARLERLDELEHDWEARWDEIEALLSRDYPRYEPPIRKMKTLSEVAQARPHLQEDFESRFEAIMEEYRGSAAFQKHLRNHGLG